MMSTTATRILGYYPMIFAISMLTALVANTLLGQPLLKTVMNSALIGIGATAGAAFANRQKENREQRPT